MFPFAMNGEVRHGLSLAVEFRADAGVVGVELAVVQRGIIVADEVEELRQLLRLEAVVDLRDPGDVGAKLAAVAQVYGGMQAEPCAVRHRVDVAAEGGLARQRVILALRVVGFGWCVFSRIAHGAGELRGVQPGGCDQPL